MANRDDNRVRVGYGLGEDGNVYPLKIDPITGRLLITIASKLSGTATATNQPLKRDDNFSSVAGGLGSGTIYPLHTDSNTGHLAVDLLQE